MHAEDLLAALDVGVGHLHLPVEPARAQQRRVQHVGAVGGGHDDDALVGLEPVHLDQQLVERLLALVVAAAIAHAARAAHGVDLVDEDDAGRVLLGLLEHVAHAARADAHEHLHEIRPRNGEERHARLARDGAGEQRLAGARRADQQRALGDLAAQTAELLRVAQELDDLFKLFLGLVDAGHVVEGHPPVLFGQQLGLGLAEAHGAAAPAALHPVHEIDPDADQQQERQPEPSAERKPEVCCGRTSTATSAPSSRSVRSTPSGLTVVYCCPSRPRMVTRSPSSVTWRDLARADALDEFRIGDRARRCGRLAVAEQVEQRQHQQEQHDPEGDVAQIAQGGLLRLATPPNGAHV
jgi:hypothetical protein